MGCTGPVREPRAPPLPTPHPQVRLLNEEVERLLAESHERTLEHESSVYWEEYARGEHARALEQAPPTLTLALPLALTLWVVRDLGAGGRIGRAEGTPRGGCMGTARRAVRGQKPTTRYLTP